MAAARGFCRLPGTGSGTAAGNRRRSWGGDSLPARRKWWEGQVVYSPDLPSDSAAQLHAKFGPAILALARQSAKTGDPIVRPLEWAWPHQRFATIKDQFMLGDEVMVAPVLTKGGRARTVVFPAGRWQGDDGSPVEGSTQREFTVPLSRLPYFQLQKREPSRSIQSP